ncbi:uncharacterized protein LOC132634252 isoform X2 [Lycium barbarum]|uniref:uncharacterized protein LOC132634252 isoform X2 n=1 Tax=Lycium barbarum TaxID=112863 RepID=UPI00293E9F8B|nr:uncharacterized protein LOC132634252 isoform X2 [Lycium barbarum]
MFLNFVVPKRKIYDQETIVSIAGAGVYGKSEWNLQSSVSIGFFPSCLTRRYWCSASFGEYIEEVYVAYEQHKLEATGLEEFQGQVKMGILKTSYKLRNWLSFS